MKNKVPIEKGTLFFLPISSGFIWLKMKKSLSSEHEKHIIEIL